MKETGIVRRIDELGRVVIPKEIRRTLRLKESDPLEIFTERDMLCFKKYSPVTSISDFAESVCAALSEMTGRLCLITDTDCVLTAKGAKAKEYIGADILKEVGDVLSARRAVVIGAETDGSVKNITQTATAAAQKYVYIVPTVAGGDLVGGVILCGENEFGDTETKLARMCADILSRQF